MIIGSHAGAWEPEGPFATVSGAWEPEVQSIGAGSSEHWSQKFRALLVPMLQRGHRKAPAHELRLLLVPTLPRGNQSWRMNSGFGKLAQHYHIVPVHQFTGCHRTQDGFNFMGRLAHDAAGV